MIGIFDSGIGGLSAGIGGLSVYREIRKLLPQEDYVYYADNAHCPYGEKTREYIIARAREITETLIGKGADIIVVACNTATAAAISTLRAEYPIRFIGMEPAIKPAVAVTRSGVVGVLATAGTLKAEKYRHTRDTMHGDVVVVEHIGQGFVELVESGETSGPHAEEVVRNSLKPLLDEGADTIVLGCTHYPFLIDVIREIAGPGVTVIDIREIAGPGVTVIDPAPAVARHLLEVMQEEGLLHGNPDCNDASGAVTENPGHSEFLSSGPDNILKKLVSKL